MSPDSERQATYDAEGLVWGDTLYAEPLGAYGFGVLVSEVLSHPWWTVLAGVAPVEVRASRREANHSRSYNGRRKVTVSLDSEDCSTLVHELAHVAQDHHDLSAPGHGPLFRRCYVDLAVLACGAEASERLAASFVRSGLDLAGRTWEPPVAPGPYGVYGGLRMSGALSCG